MASLLDITGASRRDIENWVGRLELATQYEDTGRGRARNFSRENAIELAFIAALVDGGVQVLPVATAYAASFMRQLKVGKLRKWLVFAAADPEHAKGLDTFTDAVLGDFDIRGQPPVYSVINVAEIVERVDEFFGGTQGVKASG